MDQALSRLPDSTDFSDETKRNADKIAEGLVAVPIGVAAIGLGQRRVGIVRVTLAPRVLSELQCQLFIILLERRIIACARERHTNLCLTPRITA